jgi:hypothetical protein
MVAIWDGQPSFTPGSRLGVSAIAPLSSLNPENGVLRVGFFILLIEHELHLG